MNLWPAISRWRGDLAAMRLGATLLAGRRFWLLPLAPLLWPAVQAVFLLLPGGLETFTPAGAQNALIGVPMTVLAIFLGVRVIAGELEGRSLEIVYTVPGGAHRVWLIKLAAAWGLVVVSGLLLALVAWIFFTDFPLFAFYGSVQAATFYLVLAMGLATMTRSEVAGAMGTVAVLGLNGLLTGFGDNQLRISPFWNPLAVNDPESPQLFAWTLQNRIGVALVIGLVMLLTFGRAERRERMLSG